MEIFEMQKEFDELMKKGQELIEKMKQNQSKTKRWKPTLGDTFFHITNTTQIDSMRYLTGNSHVCEKIFKTGNYFKSKEEAQKELDRRIAEQELLDLCDGYGNIEIGYRPYLGKFGTSGSDCLFGEERVLILSPYRFATEESCNKAVKQLGEEKLKLIFRID